MHARSTSTREIRAPHVRRNLLIASLVALLTPICLVANAQAGAVSQKALPTRIVSLSPTATQILFAIGAGKQLVAADADSSLPANAPRTSLSGYDPNVEAIAHYQPQLVVISYNPSGLAASLEKLGITVVDQDAANTLRDTYGQIAELGTLTGHAANAQRLIAKMRSQIAAIVAKTPTFSPKLTYYYELDQTYYTVTSATFVGSLLATLGLKNIANAAPGAASGYPQLTAEFIVKANPKVIVLADTACCGQSSATVARRPGWGSISAVKSGGVIPINDSIASQWGPNVVTLERDVEAALAKLAAKDHANLRRDAP